MNSRGSASFAETGGGHGTERGMEQDREWRRSGQNSDTGKRVLAERTQRNEGLGDFGRTNPNFDGGLAAGSAQLVMPRNEAAEDYTVADKSGAYIAAIKRRPQWNDP